MSDNKIPLINGEVLDLDKVTDVKAELTRKAHDLCLECQKYDVPIALTLLFPDRVFMSQHWAVKGTTPTDEYIKRINRFLSFMNSYVGTLTEGTFGVTRINDEPIEGYTKIWDSPKKD